jgi:hypothetical protein
LVHGPGSAGKSKMERRFAQPRSGPQASGTRAGFYFAGP